ncbi:AMP-binding enzyme family protein, partial [Vibrio harveyi]
VIFRAL